jgi:hypothetical protein
MAPVQRESGKRRKSDTIEPQAAPSFATSGIGLHF